MSFALIVTQNGDVDLAAGAVVLTSIPDTDNARSCYVSIKLGDGTKDLDGSGGEFSVQIDVGGQTLIGGPDAQTLGTAPRATITTTPFVVLAGETVTVTVTSPNAADTDVDVTASILADEAGGLIKFTPAEAADADFGATLFTIRQGDDYSDSRAVQIDLTTPADLTGKSLIVAAKRNDVEQFSYKMAIAGTAGAHYALFDASGAVTCDYPLGNYEGLLRIEHSLGVEETIWEGTVKVTAFNTP